MDKTPKQNTYAVILTAPGQKRIEVMRDIRRILGVSLQSARDLVDDAPCILADGLNKETAEKLTIALCKEGAFAQVAPSREKADEILHSALEKERVRWANQLQFAETERDAAQAELAAVKGGVLVGQANIKPGVPQVKLVSGNPLEAEIKLNALLAEGWAIAYENSGKDWYLARLERVQETTPGKSEAEKQVDAADLAENFIESIGPGITIQVEQEETPATPSNVVIQIVDARYDPVANLQRRWQQEIIEAGQPLIRAISDFASQPVIPLKVTEDNESCLKT